MKLKRWTTLLQNQVVAVVLMLMFLVPMLFSSTQARRVDQLTAYGFLGLLLFSVWLFRVRDGITIARVRGFLLSGPNLPIVLYLAWGGLSTAFSTEPFYSNFAFAQMAFGAVVYGVVVYQFRRKEQVRALLSTLLTVGVAVVLFALAARRGSGFSNLAGSFHDRQLFGAFLTLVFPVTLGIAAGTRRKLWKMGATIACVIIAGALVLTSCRSSWLGTMAALVFFGILSTIFVWRLGSISKKKHELFVTPAIAVVALGIFVAFSGGTNQVKQRAGTIQTAMTDDSVRDRLNMWNVGLKVIQKYPILGAGPGAYALAQEPLNDNSRSRGLLLALGPGLDESPHNTYVQLTAEQGLVGLALYLSILAMFFYRGVRALPRMDRGLRQYTLIGCLAAMAGQAVDGIANPGYMYPEVATFFWLILGMGMCAAGVAQEVVDDPGSRPEGDDPVLGLPRFLYRGLRTAMVACAVLWVGAQLLSLDRLSAAAAAKVHDPKEDHRPTYCDVMTKLDLDFLNDQWNPTAAWNINAGAVFEDRLAKFHVYALTDDPRFYANVTFEKKYIKWKLHGLKGKIAYTESSNNPVYSFSPAPKQGGKTGTLEVTYKCKKPNVDYTTNFFLTILPSGEPIDESAGRGRGSSSSARPMGIGPDSVNFLLSMPGVEWIPAEEVDDNKPADTQPANTTAP